MSSQCPGFNKDGSPCTATPLAGRSHCHWHDPDREEIRRESRARGGRNSSRAARAKRLLTTGMEDLGDVRDVLMVAMIDCHRGKLDPKILTAMATAARATMALTVGVELEEQISEAQREVSEIAGRIGA